MNAREPKSPRPGNAPAILILTLPQPMSRELLLELERAMAAKLGDPQRELRGAAADPGQIECASWLERLGAGPH